MSLTLTRCVLLRTISTTLRRNRFNFKSPINLCRGYFTISRIVLPATSSTFIVHNGLTRLYCTKKDVSSEEPSEGKKLSIFQRFKQMYRDYWYVLVPVHLVTSAVWFGSFYYIAKR